MGISTCSNFSGDWYKITGKVVRELAGVVEVEIQDLAIPRSVMIPKPIIAENIFMVGELQTLSVQRWFLLRNRIIPFV